MQYWKYEAPVADDVAANVVLRVDGLHDAGILLDRNRTRTQFRPADGHRCSVANGPGPNARGPVSLLAPAEKACVRTTDVSRETNTHRTRQ